MLINNSVTREWTEDYNGTGVKGLVVTGKGSFSGASLFLPAAGYCNGSSWYDVGLQGEYWSCSLFTNYIISAWDLYFNGGGNRGVGGSLRYIGKTVRPVLVLPE